MKIKIHNNSLTKISKILQCDPEDCAAWLEEFITDIRGESEPEKDKPTFEILGDNLYPEQVQQISQAIIEHYKKENEIMSTSEIVSLIYKLKVN